MEELEKIINKKKQKIDEKTEKEKNKLDFIKNIFYENSKIMQEYMKENGISLEKGYEELQTALHYLNTSLHLDREGKSFQLKEINNLLPVKLGWFDISEESKRTFNLEIDVEQCTLWLTTKGKEIEKQYRKFY